MIKTTFSLWNVHPKITQLLCNLHDGAWIAYADLQSAVLCPKGGSQGCGPGPLVFNSVYSIATELVKESVQREGLSAEWRAPTAEWWLRDEHMCAEPKSRLPSLYTGTHPEGSGVKVGEVYFVDDAGFLVTTGTAMLLLKKLRRVSAIVHSTFKRVQLKVNYSQGKTEAMVRLLGKSACLAFESLRGPDGLRLDVDEPDLDTHLHVHIVQAYAHLGTVIESNGRQEKNAKAKEEKAMCAYAPLSKKIFGCPRVRVWLKLHFFRTLIWSRCGFNHHIATPAACSTKRLNRVHLRVLRRITDCINGVSEGAHVSNVSVRRMLAEPSVDCMMTCARLLYARRVITHGPDSLNALLWNNGAPLRWAMQVKKDVECLQRAPGNGVLLSADPWHALRECPEGTWQKYVERLSWDTSTADPTVELVAPHASLNVHCTECARAGLALSFGSVKALQAHQHAKHGVRSPMRCFAPSTGICPSCGTKFWHRLRLLSHLCDSRRPRCRDRCLDPTSAIVALELAEVVRLDEADKVARREAARHGHTHVLAVGAALRHDGKVVGRVLQ
jgi:hypothetical protein